MIKTDANGRYYATVDPSKTFPTESEASIHRSYVRRRLEATRPDSRDVRQKMMDNSFQVPMAEKSPRFAELEASLKRTEDKGYSPSLTSNQRLLHSIKAMRQKDEAAEVAAADAAEWHEQPLIQAGIKEAKRILAECEDDFTRDRSEQVAAEKLLKCLNTPGADTTHIQTELRKLLGVEATRIATAQQSAVAELTSAQAKVSQLQATQRATVKVPVEGATLVERGSSLVTNLMAAEASHQQIDDAFAAVNALHDGDPAPLESLLAANVAEAAA